MPDGTEDPLVLLEPIYSGEKADRSTRPSKITITIPMEPLAVQSVRFCKFGAYQPASVKRWKSAVAAHVKQQFPWEPYEGPLKVSDIEYAFTLPKSVPKKLRKRIEAGEVFYATRSRGDLMDNLNKATFDSIAGIVFTDDKNIVICENSRKIYSIEPHITVTFEDLEGKVNTL